MHRNIFLNNIQDIRIVSLFSIKSMKINVTHEKINATHLFYIFIVIEIIYYLLFLLADTKINCSVFVQDVVIINYLNKKYF